MIESHPLAQMEVQNLPRSKEALAAVTPSTILQSFCRLACSRMYYFQPSPHPHPPDTHTDAKAGRSLPESTYSFQKSHSARMLQKGCAAFCSPLGSTCRGGCGDTPSEVASALQHGGGGFCNVLSWVASSELRIFASGTSGTLSLLACLGPE